MSSAATQDVVTPATGISLLNDTPVEPVNVKLEEANEEGSSMHANDDPEDQTILKEEEDYLMECEDSSVDIDAMGEGTSSSKGPIAIGGATSAINIQPNEVSSAANKQQGSSSKTKSGLTITEITTEHGPNQVSGDDDDDNNNPQHHAEQSNKIMLAAHAPGGRRRLFSIDIDPSSELDSNSILDSLNNPAQLLGEAGIAIDMILPPLNDSSGTNNSSTTASNSNSNSNVASTNKKTAQRDRGFSFEFFSFQADELDEVSDLMLGGGAASTSSPNSKQRPRGESIIFDPTSFDEGGIHEERALKLRQTTDVSTNDHNNAHHHEALPLTTSSSLSTTTQHHNHHHHAAASRLMTIPTIPKMLDLNSVKPDRVGSSTSTTSTSTTARHPGSQYATSSCSTTTTLSAHNPLHSSSGTTSNSNHSTMHNHKTSTTTPSLNHRTYSMTESSSTTSKNNSTHLSNHHHVHHHLPLNATTAGASSSSNNFNNVNLINKGGRIGIYLPEARKARIAKFHSKRKNRIWRKRIKYDCRKKLADSRPRVKGRFVKRANVNVNSNVGGEDDSSAGVVAVPATVAASSSSSSTVQKNAVAESGVAK
mmetsp:Transcript_22059/g.33686  ORF Transcript_22059/g.33686 Transcript_22059/m.33686 type:complete len:593 (+) Transcript_22059:322-2100(+)|eukprot:CAMPEP_0196809222 /NCGR_PEP_ID=MMETSP1362-20130617/9177_1 /TAXON_ID=163516 /ORGANISM="Leptocylindrus danicus, Strain CCMP1856" /LENGTH=592 /DNA_ID=CAMNT_0042183837 /DNA_START=270 /DNA_END=2048 /DNA_ORIENTATION=+